MRSRGNSGSPRIAGKVPRRLIDIQLTIAVTSPHSVDGNLENFPRHWLSELELFQVGIDGAEARLHAFFLSRKRVRSKGQTEIPAPFSFDRAPSVGCDHFSFGSEHGLDVQAESLRDAGSICRIRFVKVSDLQFLNAFRSLAQSADDVAD